MNMISHADITLLKLRFICGKDKPRDGQRHRFLFNKLIYS